ncbi:phosphate ABC transporter ATP-binding protein [Desulforhopalus sp. IMCC35007]|uniref:phosphate ABC transporter ATP-binding protein n=1 Tax=Desulforhopalus sp. IMCC35007 TaxID=2569543 RepID=UPI0010AE036A|nr:phosphate ABC transporter ATP-binding protein [Desulforhopalus sp. IMCC35007]TKB09285.1 phosphate ABC transporter ATP-binding protein [Desulforhopalus sp. IMCC35007]
MQDNTKIFTEGVRFSYQNKVVLEDINLSLPENNIIAVTGPSGTGKSTFLSIFNRLWEENGGGDCEGQVMVRFNEKMVNIYGTEIPVAQLRRLIGMVFQAPNPLPMTVFKNIAFPFILQGGMKKEEMAEKVEIMLRRVHLFDEVKDRLTSDARNLSGGQQQRLCIARTLISDPEIILLDEPTSSLDGKACEKIEELIRELRENCTLLLVSHYQDQVQRLADQVYELENRRLRRVS